MTETNKENGVGEDGKGKDSIMATVNENDERKLFVNSLSWETTEAQFREYFEKFGAVKEATIKLNELGQSKGFGFILFEDSASIDKVNGQATHTLNGRKINAKKATPKERIKKIFVGGVSPDLPEADIRTHFEQFGEIESMELPMNKEKTPPIRKGFIFITFKDADACDAATAKGKLKQELGDRSVDVKKAVPQDVHQGRGTARGTGGGRGRGAPRGGAGAMAAGAYGAYADPYGYYGFDPYYGYDPYAYGYAYGYPPAPPVGGGKMRGGPRGRGRGARARGRPY